MKHKIKVFIVSYIGSETRDGTEAVDKYEFKREIGQPAVRYGNFVGGKLQKQTTTASLQHVPM